ncbi:hypothetical protein [Frigidibacter oleivorans]|uniref:hypothetical protein n=1 Tax=Frigidibacter oleivorans TaxID=2487129 RepID=UPI000F8CF587|nr:hypothetical protein [Frigidibacter oleivorans]
MTIGGGTDGTGRQGGRRGLTAAVAAGLPDLGPAGGARLLGRLAGQPAPCPGDRRAMLALRIAVLQAAGTLAIDPIRKDRPVPAMAGPVAATEALSAPVEPATEERSAPPRRAPRRAGRATGLGLDEAASLLAGLGGAAEADPAAPDPEPADAQASAVPMTSREADPGAAPDKAGPGPGARGRRGRGLVIADPGVALSQMGALLAAEADEAGETGEASGVPPAVPGEEGVTPRPRNS